MILTIFCRLSAYRQKSKKHSFVINWLLINCCKLVNWNRTRFRTQCSKSCQIFVKILSMTLSSNWPIFITEWLTIWKILSERWVLKLITTSQFSSWRHIFRSWWNDWKYIKKNISRTEHDFSTKWKKFQIVPQWLYYHFLRRDNL